MEFVMRIRSNPFHPAALVAFSLTWLATACGGDSLSIPNGDGQQPGGDDDTEVLNSKVFLTAEEFKQLVDEGATVYDQRNAAKYGTEHVRGAINFSWSAFAIPEKNGIVKETPEELQVVARSFGLNKEGKVVIYGDWGAAASNNSRAYWTLEYIGHSDVYLLNGDTDAIKAVGVEFDDEPVTPTEGDFEVKLRPQIRATFQELVEATSSGDAVIVDTRTPDEYEGIDLRGNPRGGHVPGAVHIEWTRTFEEGTQSLLSDEKLRELLESNGVVPGKYVVGYCQSGVRSSFFYAILRKLGYPIAKNYDGSAWEWSRQPTAPIVEGGE
jgi:thiosulfate/3-mercaptopyruvate sulfurtransferase